MKIIMLFFLFFFIFGRFIYGQDAIILKTQEVVYGKVIKVSDNEIEYKTVNNESPIYGLKPSKVAGIIYQNGQIDFFDTYSMNLYLSNKYKKDMNAYIVNQYKDTIKIKSATQDKNSDSVYMAKIEKMQKEMLKQKEELEKANKKLEEKQMLEKSVQKETEINSQNNKKNIDTLKLNFENKIINEDSTSFPEIELLQKEIKDQKEEIDKNKKIQKYQQNQDSIQKALNLKYEKEISILQKKIENQQLLKNDKTDQLYDSIISYNNKLFKLIQNNKSEETKWIPKPFGIGVDVAGVLRGYVESNWSLTDYLTYSPYNIFLSFDFNRHIRLETEFAASFINYDGVTGGASRFAVGILGMWQRGKTNFYTGIKTMRTGYSVHYKSQDSTNYITYFAPSIGAEYAFGNHFSIGSEIEFPFGINGKASTIWIGFNRFILRYYLGNNFKKNKK